MPDQVAIYDKVVRFARQLKAGWHADNGMATLRPMVVAFDGFGRRDVGVLLGEGTPEHVLEVTAALSAAWRPWAVVFIAEAFIRVTPPDDDDVVVPLYRGEFAQRFADGDAKVGEALMVSMHYRTPFGVVSLDTSLPFRYRGSRLVWDEPISPEGDEATEGAMWSALHYGMDVDPVPDVSSNDARRTCIAYLTARGCAVVVTGGGADAA